MFFMFKNASTTIAVFTNDKNTTQEGGMKKKRATALMHKMKTFFKILSKKNAKNLPVITLIITFLAGIIELIKAIIH